MRTLRQRRGKSVLLWTMAAIGLFLIASPAWLQAQQDFPSKPITIIVAGGAGGLIDLGTRIFAERFSRELKVPVVIENKPGGGPGIVGISAFLNTSPDGYTLLAASGAGLLGPVQLSKTPAYDTRKDILPIGYIADAPCALSVAKNAPFKTWEELVKYAKANPGKLRGGVSALGGETHIMLEALLKQTKMETKIVPYPATGQLVTAMMGAHLDWMVLSMPATMPYHKSGDVKIALLTRRSPDLPGVPAGIDVGMPDVSINLSMGLLAHPKIPKSAYDKVVAAATATANDPEVAKKLSGAGLTLAFKGPQDYSQLINSQYDIFGRLLKEANIKVE
jgi:tripartite-type tricarboxylate transporter receptor subunit TctC